MMKTSIERKLPFSHFKAYLFKADKSLNLGHYVSDVFKEEEYTSTTLFFEEKISVFGLKTMNYRKYSGYNLSLNYSYFIRL